MNHDSIERSISELKTLGFEGFRTVRALFKSCADVSEQGGIYLVLYLDKELPEFSARGAGGFFKGRNPNVGISELKSKWIDGTIIAYIGQTRSSLNRRISTLMDFGKGMPVGHYGGRYLWQIQNYEDLVVCWKSCPDEIDSRQIEHELLQRLRRIHGKLPFANLRE